MQKIAYLGPEGTYSEEAARLWLGSNAVVMQPLGSLVQIVQAVLEERIDWGLLPAENSCEGSLPLTLDMLIDKADCLQIYGEIVLPIQHHFLIKPGALRKDIKVITSHSQALAQCRNYIERHFPKAQIIEQASTAEAVQAVARSEEDWAAIGTSRAASLYGLEIADRDVADLSENATRFLVIGRQGAYVGAANKTTVLIGVNNQPGALYNLLGEFALRKINLTRIESRPAKTRLGDYLFFIDFEGALEEPSVIATLSAAHKWASYLKVLGTYQAAGNERQTGGGESCELKRLRAQVDIIDAGIVRLLAERTAWVRQIGREKGVQLSRQPDREKQVLARLRELAEQQGVDPQLVEDLYALLFEHYVALQKRL